jgi:hypothetical protein
MENYKGYKIIKSESQYNAISTEGLIQKEADSIGELKEKIDLIIKDISLRAFIQIMKSEFSLTPWELLYQCLCYDAETFASFGDASFKIKTNYCKWNTASGHIVRLYFYDGELMPDHCTKYLEKIIIQNDESENFYPAIKNIAERNNIKIEYSN